MSRRFSRFRIQRLLRSRLIGGTTVCGVSLGGVRKYGHEKYNNDEIFDPSSRVGHTTRNGILTKNSKPTHHLSTEQLEHLYACCLRCGLLCPSYKQESAGRVVARDVSMGVDQSSTPLKTKWKWQKDKAMSLQAIRKWHKENGYPGEIMNRQSESKTSSLPHTEFSSNSSRSNLNCSSNSDSILSSTGYSDELPRTTWIKKKSDTFVEILLNENEATVRECYFVYCESDPKTGKKHFDICIRGTTCWSDFLYNVQISKTWDDELQRYIHKGFLQKSNLLLGDLLALWGGEESVGKENMTISLHGHSLGGAMACIIAWKLEQRGYNVKEVVSFGAPKFCTNQYAARDSRKDTCDSNMNNLNGLENESKVPYYNIQDLDDFVTYLPPDDPVSYLRKGGFVPIGMQVRTRAPKPVAMGKTTNEDVVIPAENDSTLYNKAERTEAIANPSNLQVPNPEWLKQKITSAKVSVEGSTFNHLSRFEAWFRRSFLMLPVHNLSAHRLRSYAGKLDCVIRDRKQKGSAEENAYIGDGNDSKILVVS